MILYQSTRGDKRLYKFSEVILKGIAPDGGLFVPEKIPHLSFYELEKLVDKPYQERAFFILDKFETGFEKKTLKEIINKAYANNFDTPQIAPLSKLKDNQYLLELWHGPTSAFKDMALQLKPYFFSHALQADNKKRKCLGKKPLHYLILVATSGDTGKAALEGYKDKKGVDIIVFYPDGGVSKLQELQMITQEGKNVAVVGVYGDFDDTQRIVKEIFNEAEFNEKLLKNYNTLLSSANSINWGRLLPQIIYHLSSYLDLVSQKVVTLGEPIDIAVPTGNFGNILAAYYARKMGLPIRKLICASNENNVLTEVLKTGVYDVKKRKLVKTPSPSMDIIIASNFERLLYDLTKDPEKISSWMRQLKTDGFFKVDRKTKAVFKKLFYADWVSNDDCLDTIKKTCDETNYLLDPHTAVAQTVVDRYKNKYGSKVPVVICSTANWAKFPKDVYRGLMGIKSKQDEFGILKEINKLVPNVTIPRNIRALQNKKIRHTAICNIGKEEVEKVILQYLSKCYNGNN